MKLKHLRISPFSKQQKEEENTSLTILIPCASASRKLYLLTSSLSPPPYLLYLARRQVFPRKKKRCATRIKSQKTPPRRSQGKYSNIKLVRAPSHPQANSDGLLSYEIFVLFFLHSLNTEFKTGRLDYLFGTNAAVLTCSQQSGSGIPRCAVPVPVPVHTNP